MLRIIQRQTTTIQIVSAEVIWADEGESGGRAPVNVARAIIPKRAASRRKKPARRNGKRSNKKNPAFPPLTSE